MSETAELAGWLEGVGVVRRRPQGNNYMGCSVWMGSCVV